MRPSQHPRTGRGSEPFRILAPDGTPVGDTDVGLDPDAPARCLRWMMLARRLDRECIALQRQGELTVYPGFEGQEAAQIGSAIALGPDDFVFPTFRELAVALVRGVDAVAVPRSTTGERGTAARTTRARPGSGRSASRSPRRSSHAVGYAMGQRLDGIRACTIAYFGDGSASEGDFHEAANLAGVFGAPPILFCQNNGWAISVPTAHADGRARSGGAPRATGSRASASTATTCSRCTAVTKDAVDRARAGDGPTLIEALTYRIGAHSTADDPGRYRDDDEVEAARAFDPIARFRDVAAREGTPTRRSSPSATRRPRPSRAGDPRRA